VDYQPVLRLGEFIGHGLSDDGRVYEGYIVDGEYVYRYVDDGSDAKEYIDSTITKIISNHG
jgi:hypothetical protein